MYSDNFNYNNEIIDNNLLSDKDIKNLIKNDNIFLFLNYIPFFKDIPKQITVLFIYQNGDKHSFDCSPLITVETLLKVYLKSIGFQFKNIKELKTLKKDYFFEKTNLLIIVIQLFIL